MPNLQGQTALVTGASRGIGRAIALHLAKAGAEVIVHYHKNRAAAESVAGELGGTARLAQADLRSPREIDALVKTLADVRLDVLVNNAALWGGTPLGSTSLETLEAMLDANVKGVFWLTQAVLPLFREGSRIVNISSLAGRIGRAGGRSLYGATKAAVDAFTRNWALELAPRKIRVNAVAPGYIDTDMTAGYFSDPKVLQHAVDRQPFGRLGRAEEVADVVLFLCSPASNWITGESLNVSGGFVV
ncbi:MAG TPA: SDR family oxidoreductase [Terriglobales bacterium]|jgi:3-oxoacyl-[acyl-carrier protein] reductase|nr:SDR family oxidoreductase [Terriglobales bacterium]